MESVEGENCEFSFNSYEEQNKDLITDNQYKEKVKAYINGFFNGKEKEEISIEDKITFSAFIINHRQILIGLEDFYEEECQFAIINWVVEYRRQLHNESNILPIALLYNLIIILELFPIKTKDFISLKIIDKLKSIKRSIKKARFEYAVRLQCMIDFWEERIKEIVIMDKEERFLNRKTKRSIEEEDRDDDNNCKMRRKIDKDNYDEGDSFDSASIESTYGSEIGINDKKSANKRNNKKVKWKENIIEEIVYLTNDCDQLKKEIQNKQ